MTTEIDFSQAIAKTREEKILDKPFITPNGFASFAVFTRDASGQIVKVCFNAAAHQDKNFYGPKYLSEFWSNKVSKASETRKIMGLDNLANFFAEKVVNPKSDESWNGYEFYNESDLLKAQPSLKNAPSIFTENIVTNKGMTHIGSDTQYNSEVKKKLDSVTSK